MQAEPASFLVAHRGDQEGAGENTLAAFDAAVRAGARYIECDVQFTRDLVPLVMHDNDLGRLFGAPGLRLANHSLAEVMDGAPEFKPLRLEKMLQWLGAHPGVTLFLEFKPSILKHYRAKTLLRNIESQMREVATNQLVIISQTAAWLEACAARFPFLLGWVATHHRPPAVPLAFVFLDKRYADSAFKWQGEGTQVALYTINESTEAHRLYAGGADLIETNFFSRLNRELGHA